MQAQAVDVDPPHPHGDAGLGQPHPGADIGFVIGLGDDHLVARLQAGADGLDQGADERGGGGPHDDLVVVGGMDEVGDGPARRQHPLTRLLRCAVAGAELHVVVQQVVADAVGNPAQHLRPARVV